MKSKGVRYWLSFGLRLLVGTALGAASFSFLTYPNDIVSGGVTGISQILNRLLNTPVGLVIIVLNVPLFLFSLKKFGLQFFIGTAVTTVLSSVFIDLFALLPLQVTGDHLLAAVYGGVLNGIGYGLIYTTGVTSGGVDIITYSLRRRNPQFNFGTIGLALDVVVVLAYAVIFGKYDSCMYTIITMFICSRVINLVLYGLDNSSVCYIITSRKLAPEINKAVGEGLHRGVTILRGEGGWTGEDRAVMLTVIKRNQIAALRRCVSELDPHAFVIMTESHEIYGEGFSKIID